MPIATGGRASGALQGVWPGLYLYVCDPGPQDCLKLVSPGQTRSIGGGGQVAATSASPANVDLGMNS